MSAKYLNMTAREAHFAALHGIARRAIDAHGSLTPEQAKWLMGAAWDWDGAEPSSLELQIATAHVPLNAVRHIPLDLDWRDRARKLAKMAFVSFEEFCQSYALGHIDTEPDEDEKEMLQEYAELVHFPYDTVEAEYLVGNLTDDTIIAALDEAAERQHDQVIASLAIGDHPLAAAYRVLHPGIDHLDEDIQLAERFGFITVDIDAVDDNWDFPLCYVKTSLYLDAFERLCQERDPITAYKKMEAAWLAEQETIAKVDALSEGTRYKVRRYVEALDKPEDYGAVLLAVALNPDFEREIDRALRVEVAETEDDSLTLQQIEDRLLGVTHHYQTIYRGDIPLSTFNTLRLVSRALGFGRVAEGRISGATYPTATREDLNILELSNLLAYCTAQGYNDEQAADARYKILHGVMSINDTSVDDILAGNV